jgi:hypothetical protein
MIAQTASSSSGEAGAILIVLLVWFGLAGIPAAIAHSKGHNAFAYFAFGLFLFLPALIVALMLQPEVSADKSVQRPHEDNGWSDRISNAPDETATNVGLVIHHQIAHPSPWLYSCTCGSFSAPTLDAAEAHLASVNTRMQLTNEFAPRPAQEGHRLTFLAATRYWQCNDCDFVTRLEWGAKDHTRTTAGRPTNGSTPVPSLA